MTDKPGVLLVQLGGPERREELRPFLYELFADPEILSIPAPFRQVAAYFIARLRAPVAAKTYEQIGWSPIRRWSRTQAELLERELALDGTPAAVRVGMTCSAPTVEEALASLEEAGTSRLVVLPLYPQYSVTTTKGLVRPRDEVPGEDGLESGAARRSRLVVRRASFRRRARRPDPSGGGVAPRSRSRGDRPSLFGPLASGRDGREEEGPLPAACRGDDRRGRRGARDTVTARASATSRRWGPSPGSPRRPARC